MSGHRIAGLSSYTSPAWTFATSPSRARSASASPRWPSVSAPVSTRSVVLDDRDNPFLSDFYTGRDAAAFQAQLFFTLARHRQQLKLRQGDLFNQTTVCDYLFERDRIYAFLNLDDNELFIYQRLFELVSRDVPAPDLVIYLQAPTDLLKKRVRERAKRADIEEAAPSDDYLAELNEAYNHFFFHYTATPLLVVETSHFDLSWGDDAIDGFAQANPDDGQRDAVLRAAHGMSARGDGSLGYWAIAASSCLRRALSFEGSRSARCAAPRPNSPIAQ